MDDNTIDGIMAGVYAFVFILYHAYIIHLSKTNPAATVMGIARAARTNWILLYIKRGDHTMVFQAIRNLLSTSSTLSSTAISVAFGMFAFISGFALTGNASNANNSENTIAINFTGWKLGIVMAGLFATFLFFAQSMRLWSHVAFLIETKSTLLSAADRTAKDTARGIIDLAHTPKDWFPAEFQVLTDLTPSQIADMMNSAAMHYTLGTRAFYFSFPLLLFFFNKWIFLAGAIVTLIAVMLMDSAGIAGWTETAEDDEEIEVAKRRRTRRVRTLPGMEPGGQMQVVVEPAHEDKVGVNGLDTLYVPKTVDIVD
jgi:uncharacterized membrane protein